MEKYTVFKGVECIGSGNLAEVAEIVRRTDTGQTGDGVLVFCDSSGEQTDVCVINPEVVRGRGRPKLGVVPREITLLPRHWEWLNAQHGGASVALRRLIDEARKNPKEEKRRVRDAVYKFLSALCGDFPDYEESVRALYADNGGKFFEYIGKWPKDVRQYIEKISDGAFDD